VKSFEELKVKAKSGKVLGKIIVFVEKWAGYSNTVRYRRASADVEKLGAVGVLVKSVGPFSLNSPHTGTGARGESKIKSN
jgi:carboxypeptidase Q